MILFKWLPDYIEDMIMLYLNSENIQRIGESNLSVYVWLRKKDKTIKEAIENNNLIGLKYLIEHGNVNVHAGNDEALRNSAKMVN